jgi:nucleotidyltransferase substrate binding protein (TIGR01987 family)
MALDISSLENAVEKFEIALAAHAERPNDLLVRDACIQRFEYCFELSHKMLRRHLMATEAEADEIVTLSFPDLMRLAFVRNLTAHEWRVWRHYRDIRNTTSHAYDAQKAAHAKESFPEFLAVVQDLVTKLSAQIALK